MCSVCCGGVADDGKHASSVIEVESASWRLNEREVWRERCSGNRGRVADDGKHAFSVIEVDISPQGKIERRFGGEGASVPKGLRGFKANGRFGATSFDVFVFFFFRSAFGRVFFALERPSAPFWLHFGVILASNSSLFLNNSFF